MGASIYVLKHVKIKNTVNGHTKSRTYLSVCNSLFKNTKANLNQKQGHKVKVKER